MTCKMKDRYPRRMCHDVRTSELTVVIGMSNYPRANGFDMIVDIREAGPGCWGFWHPDDDSSDRVMAVLLRRLQVTRVQYPHKRFGVAGVREDDIAQRIFCRIPVMIASGMKRH
jgi:hypothetical protein